MFRLLTLIALLISSIPLSCCGCCANSGDASQVVNVAQRCPHCGDSTNGDSRSHGNCPCGQHRSVRQVERQLAETVQLPTPNPQWNSSASTHFHASGLMSPPCRLADTTAKTDFGKLSVLLC